MDSEKKVGLSTVPTSSNNSGDDVHVGSATQYGETQRGLSPRHVQLMAIGGSIGTGLWVCFFVFPPLPSPPLSIDFGRRQTL